jgi:hypothetical protein
MRASLLVLLGVLPLAACQTPLAPVDGASDDDASVTGDGSVVNPAAILRYTPTGCGYEVHTTMGTRNAAMDQATFGASPTPTNLHVTWPGDPATTAAVLWATDEGTLASVVQYGTAMDQLTQTARGHRATVPMNLGPATHVHEVHLCGLTPGTTYYYRAGGADHFSPVQTFTTAPAPGSADDVNFVVCGDSRDNLMVWSQVQQAVLAIPGGAAPDFQLFSGDAIALGSMQNAWNDWFASAAPTLARMPLVMAHGNHEALTVNYLQQFAQPQDADSERDELFFSYNYGPVHIIVLNDTPRSTDYAAVYNGPERTWLEADLQAVNRTMTPWIVVMHHKPAFSSSSHAQERDTLAIRAAWPPVFDRFDVDAVFSGHDHDFEITQSLDGAGQRVTGQHGTVYVTAGSSGATPYPSGTSPFTRYSESVVNFMLVRATRTTLDLIPYRVSGATPTEITQGRTSLTRM